MWASLVSISVAGEPAIPGEHARHAAEHPHRVVAPHRRASLPDVTPGPTAKVYGYQAYWDDDLEAVPWDQISHLALFNVAVHSDGSLDSTTNWADAALAVSIAEAYGVRIHLCVTADSEKAGNIVASAAARERLSDELVSWLAKTGAHGVNIDFEAIPASGREGLIDLAEELEVSIGDVTIATPTVDWSEAYDYGELAKHADLFLMGYNYHWSGSSEAGPVDPLYGGGDWFVWSLAWSIDDYLAKGADPKRVILGLPLYGYEWPVDTDEMGADATGPAKAILWAECQEKLASGGKWDDGSKTPWWSADGRQGWCGNEESLRLRVEYAVDAGIGGVGFWALHYDDDDASLWAMIGEETTWIEEDTDEPEDTDVPEDTGEPDTDTGTAEDTDVEEIPAFIADAGRPFLAYVGDTVILSGQGSEGPAGMQFAWTQIEGPTVQLSATDVVDPRFLVEYPGTTVFELRVGDGMTWSDPARSYVIVIDEAAAPPEAKGCGCASGRMPVGSLVLGLLMLALRRR